MKVKQRLLQLTAKALYESIDLQTMISLTRRILPDYDVYKSLQISESLSIPKQDIAQQVISDLNQQDCYLDFLALMLIASHDGLNGRMYKFPHLRQILKDVDEAGLVFDWNTRMFMENPQIRKTRNWGILKEDNPYFFTFLRTDIVGNTDLVRSNPSGKIKKTYSVIKEIVTTIVEERNGRVWRWDGDGGIIAFHYQDRHEQAVLSALEILHWLFTFNHFNNPLDRPVLTRIAVGNGSCYFSMDDEKIMQSDTIKKIMTLESKYTDPDSITVTEEIWQHLDPVLGAKFELRQAEFGSPVHNYALRWRDE